MPTASLRALSIAHPELKAAEVILIPDEFIVQQLIEQEKKLHQGVRELLVKCITEGSPPQLKWLLLQGHFQFCVMQFYSVHPALSVRPSIGRLIGWLVSWSPLNFLAFLSFLSSLLLPKCPSDLFCQHPCPHATRVAVYPA